MRVLSQLSGGLDSVASTFLVADTATEFQTIFFDLDQPYVLQELRAVKYVDKLLTERYTNYKGLKIVKANLALTASDGPSEYIPVRNLVLGAMSANQAISLDYDAIAVGNKTTEVRPDDPYSFSDCSVEFYSRLGALATFASEGRKLEFVMPLLKSPSEAMTKAEVIQLLLDREVDVRRLWSCYQAGDTYCGQCYHCEEIKHTGLWNHFI